MRRSARWVLFGLAACVVVGCQGTDKHDTEVPLVMEFVTPPDEERFNNAPEQGYRKPAAKKEFKPGFGGGPGAGGAGAPLR